MSSTQDSVHFTSMCTYQIVYTRSIGWWSTDKLTITFHWPLIINQGVNKHICLIIMIDLTCRAIIMPDRVLIFNWCIMNDV